MTNIHSVATLALREPSEGFLGRFRVIEFANTTARNLTHLAHRLTTPAATRSLALRTPMDKKERKSQKNAPPSRN